MKYFLIVIFEVFFFLFSLTAASLWLSANQISTTGFLSNVEQILHDYGVLIIKMIPALKSYEFYAGLLSLMVGVGFAFLSVKILSTAKKYRP
ncbi:hypothetical protein [Legionella maceachernii]|uniref:Uncharacterized protein n=1 Tax=Legionella maceachernii TaxID=466 RepID=A0A0W0WE03_9GAMM|nr:hypothetical protein [Legionella maceachernii]KTD30587.1 hypothetical protein Lmac_0531 [Legionella maceachernii]SJZ97634.1 hypothetical protein SAMN02745128_01620 [Legionella maceachernii]SUP01087.1 Uncharacterised protein [Legionella maceachernii]